MCEAAFTELSAHSFSPRRPRQRLLRQRRTGGVCTRKRCSGTYCDARRCGRASSRAGCRSRPARSVKLAEQFQANSDAHYWSYWSAAVAELLALTGKRDKAAQIVAQREFRNAAYPMSKFRKALLSLALDRHEAAISFLQVSVKELEAESIWLAVEPRMDPIGKKPIYGNLEEKDVPAAVTLIGRRLGSETELPVRVWPLSPWRCAEAHQAR